MESLEYLPIQSLDIEAEREISFDLFLNLPLNQKVILYRRKGGTLESDRLAKLVGTTGQNFCIRKEDYNAFVRYVALRVKGLIDHPNQVVSREMMITTAKSILSSTFASSDTALTKALMGNLNEITGMIIEAALDKVSPARKRTFRKLVELSEKGSDFHKHPVNVTSLSVLIAFGIGYSTEKILTEVAMGALLHDVGLAQLPAHIIPHAHNPLALTPEDRALLYQHGQRGLQILEEKNITISEVMRAIVTQHHEQFNGSGYPAGLRGYVVNEFAQIVRVADDLDRLLEEPATDADFLRRKLTQLFTHLHKDKVIEPALASRIRLLFLET